jgi:putative ABC transport system permease protein
VPLLARLRSLLRDIRRNDTLDHDMDAEFRLHMELRAEDLVRGGLTPAEAARQARLEFGSTDAFKDRGRDARGLRVFDSLRFSMLDLRLGVRMLRKHPGLTTIGAIAVAFAIAIGTTGFEIVAQILFPTIPLPDGNAIVAFRNWNVALNTPAGVSRGDYAAWKRDLTTVTTLATSLAQSRNVSIGDAAATEPVSVTDVTASMFELTRVPALLGRTLLPGDEAADARDVAVVSYDFWQNQLAAATNVIGRSMSISGSPTTIVGVMPRTYAFPRRTGIWRPLHLERLYETSRLPLAFGRINAGHTFDEASAEFAALSARNAASFPETNRDIRAQMRSLSRMLLPVDDEVRMVAASLNIFFLIFLALVCGNVALLLFARAASRQTEIVVRVALGASRGRIITQLFAEALVLCLVGAVIGLVASTFLLRWAWTIGEGQLRVLPFWMGGTLSASTIAYAVGLTLFAAAIAGVVPALKVTSGGVDARLRAMSSGGGGMQFGGVWTGVIVAQIALTVTLPFVTHAIRADFVRLRDTPARFAADEFLSATLSLDRLDGAAARGDTTPAARAALFESRYRMLADRLMAEPGVLGVTYANRLPLMDHPARMMEMDAGPAAPRDPNWPDGYRVGTAIVDPRFFDVLGTPVIRGRSLTSIDAVPSPTAVLVNESFVKRVLGGRNPIGRQLRFLAAESQPVTPDGKPGPWLEIVGVVPDLGISGTEFDPKVARVYAATQPKYLGGARLAVHVRGDPQRFAPRLREIAASVDPALRVADPLPVSRLLDTEVDFLAFFVRLLAGVSAVALLLSLAGVYAVTAFAVAKRTREIGVRVALGARPRQIIVTVFKRPFIQMTSGVGVGAIVVATLAAWGDSRIALKDLGVPASFAVVVGVICLLACIVPARRALGIQPTEALKDEG